MCINIHHIWVCSFNSIVAVSVAAVVVVDVVVDDAVVVDAVVVDVVDDNDVKVPV